MSTCLRQHQQDNGITITIGIGARVVRLLLEFGADKTIKDNDGRRAFDHASDRDDTACMALLAIGITFASKNGYRLPFVADTERSLYSAFAKKIIPRTYVIDHTGSIRFEIVGFDQEKFTELDAKISELIEE